MTPLSRWKFSTQDEEKVKQVLVLELVKISEVKNMEAMIGVLMTETEQLMMAKRIFAFVLIDQGMNNMDIAKKLHFTRETVA
jgi:hypothetical protein